MIQIGEIIFVLGMHRSGTSAITRLLNILGADPGKKLLPSDIVNKKGYWENQQLIKLHDKILETFDSAWYDFRSYPEEWWLKKDIQVFHQEILEVLEQSFDSYALMLVKDPRISRMLPLWLSLLQKSGGSPKCVIVMRNPLEVARSIERRDQFSLITSLYLWLLYTLESEWYSRGLARTIVKFDEVLVDWKSTVAQLTTDLNIQWPANLTKVRKTIESDLDPNLRHHTIEDTPDDVDDLTRTALDLYRMITSNPLHEIQDYLDEIRIKVYDDLSLHHSWSKALFETNRVLFETKKELRLIREKSIKGKVRRLRFRVGKALNRK